MRLTLVTETFPPEVNGVAMTLGRLVAGLAHRGHQVQVVRPRQLHEASRLPDDPPVQSIVVPGLPLPRYPGLRFGLPCGRRLRAAWEHQRPQVVHIATEGPLGISARRTAERLRIPTTSSFHTNFHSYGRHYGYGLLLKPMLAHLRRLHNRTGCTMVPSKDVQETLTAAGFARVEVLSRGVDQHLFNPRRRSIELRQRWGVDDHDLVVLYVGRLAPEKNIALTVKAFTRIKAQRPDARLVLVGDGPARAGLAQQVPDAVFAGMRRGEDLGAHYASGDLFLFGSTTETFGNVITEAMASGLAVVAYNYAAAREHIRDGVNGKAVAFNDESAFLHAAEELARDDAQRQQLASAAALTGAGISWDAVIDRFAQLLEAAVERGVNVAG